jgi:hypothetical protein
MESVVSSAEFESCAPIKWNTLFCQDMEGEERRHVCSHSIYVKKDGSRVNVEKALELQKRPRTMQGLDGSNGERLAIYICRCYYSQSCL